MRIVTARILAVVLAFAETTTTTLPSLSDGLETALPIEVVPDGATVDPAVAPDVGSSDDRSTP
ncbi:MAG TPA: hypothetical protein VFD84_18715 [Candidatus Binatia bacterium]|jgi:hypothetical protein|nr:hypothetical protein [Candidatus Binatia bacterium]